jgi:hypothetical protein
MKRAAFTVALCMALPCWLLASAGELRAGRARGLAAVAARIDAEISVGMTYDQVIAAVGRPMSTTTCPAGDAVCVWELGYIRKIPGGRRVIQRDLVVTFRRGEVADFTDTRR